MIGTGYVGLVTAAGFAELGSEVWCVDVDADKIARLQRGEIPIYEPGLDESVARHRERLHFSTELAPRSSTPGCCSSPWARRRPIPGDADLSAVHAVVGVDAGLRPARAGDEVDGAGRDRRGDQARCSPSGQGRASPTCPARSSSRRARRWRTSCEPDRVVIGDEGNWAGDAVAELYAPLNAPVVRTDIASAEMVKLAANAFLATKISFINEIANVCEETGADVLEVARGMGLDQRIGPHFLKPGIGFGGSCFPKDVSALKQLAGNSGYHFQLLTAVIEVNELQKRRVVGKLQKHLGSLVGQDGRAARAGLQGQHRRHARGLLAGARRPPAGRRRARARLRPGRRGRGPQADGRRRVRRLGAGGAARAPTPASSSPSGPSSPSSTGARSRGDDRRRWWSTGATSSTATPSAPPGFVYEGIGR